MESYLKDVNYKRNVSRNISLSDQSLRPEKSRNRNVEGSCSNRLYSGMRHQNRFADDRSALKSSISKPGNSSFQTVLSGQVSLFNNVRDRTTNKSQYLEVVGETSAANNETNNNCIDFSTNSGRQFMRHNCVGDQFRRPNGGEDHQFRRPNGGEDHQFRRPNGDADLQFRPNGDEDHQLRRPNGDEDFQFRRPNGDEDLQFRRPNGDEDLQFKPNGDEDHQFMRHNGVGDQFRRPNGDEDHQFRPNGVEDHQFRRHYDVKIPNSNKMGSCDMSVAASFFPTPIVSMQKIKEDMLMAISMMELMHSGMCLPLEKLNKCIQKFLIDLKRKSQKLIHKSVPSNMSSMCPEILTAEKIQCIQQWINANVVLELAYPLPSTCSTEFTPVSLLEPTRLSGDEKNVKSSRRACNSTETSLAEAQPPVLNCILAERNDNSSKLEEPSVIKETQTSGQKKSSPVPSSELKQLKVRISNSHKVTNNNIESATATSTKAEEDAANKPESLNGSTTLKVKLCRRKIYNGENGPFKDIKAEKEPAKEKKKTPEKNRGRKVDPKVPVRKELFTDDTLPLKKFLDTEEIERSVTQRKEVAPATVSRREKRNTSKEEKQETPAPSDVRNKNKSFKQRITSTPLKKNRRVTPKKTDSLNCSTKVKPAPRGKDTKESQPAKDSKARKKVPAKESAKPAPSKGKKRTGTKDESESSKKKKNLDKNQNFFDDSFQCDASDTSMFFGFQVPSPEDALNSIRKKTVPDTSGRETPPTFSLCSFMNHTGQTKSPSVVSKGGRNSALKSHAADRVAKKTTKTEGNDKPGKRKVEKAKSDPDPSAKAPTQVLGTKRKVPTKIEPVLRRKLKTKTVKFVDGESDI